MKKRFTDTEIYDKPWFMDLKLEEKLAVKFIFDKCDNVGVWTPNYRVVEFYVGCEIDLDKLPEKTNGNIIILDNGKWWVVKFCNFQYSNLSEDSTSKPILSYIKLLKEHNLWITYTKGINTLKEKEKDKEKDKERDKDKNKEKKKEKDLKNSNNIAQELLIFLNQKKQSITGKESKYSDYEPIQKTLSRPGITPENIRQLIINQTKNPYMQDNPQYYCPATLMRKSHYDKYLNTDYDEKSIEGGKSNVQKITESYMKKYGGVGNEGI